MRKGAAISLVLLITSLTGCEALVGRGVVSSHDFTQSGNAKGWRAYNDGQIGAMKTMVEPNAESHYLSHREREDKELTKRNDDGEGFWSRVSRKAKAELAAELAEGVGK